MSKQADAAVAGSWADNWLGSKLAIQKDTKIIRPIMLCVTALLFFKVLLDML